MDTHATPPKAKRAQHQHHHARSGTVPTPTGTDGDQRQRSTNKQKHDRNASHYAQNQAHQPAWGDMTAGDANEGHFDSDGRFIGGAQDSSAADESPAPSRARKGRAKHNAAHSAVSAHPQSHMASGATMTAASPAKVAYAGPTFHASPAASALPKPSFMSKSVPGDTKPTGLQARLEQEKADSESSTSSTPAPAQAKPTTNALPREESPLEFFFKADRAEKSKAQLPDGPETPREKAHLPVAQSAPPGNNWPNIYQHDGGHHQRTTSTQSQKGMFALELDGTGIQPGRSTAPTVHQQRPAGPAATASRPTSHAESDPIRRFLLETASTSSPSPKPSFNQPQRTFDSTFPPPESSPFLRPSPAQRSSSGPSTPQSNPQPPHGGLHYGNRNLSPLFQAARSPLNNASMPVRGQLGPSPPPQQSVPHQQWASIYQQQPAQRFPGPPNHSVNSAAPPPGMPARSQSYGASAANTSDNSKSMEDDLRRILKLTASSGGATGVQG